MLQVAFEIHSFKAIASWFALHDIHDLFQHDLVLLIDFPQTGISLVDLAVSEMVERFWLFHVHCAFQVDQLADEGLLFLLLDQNLGEVRLHWLFGIFHLYRLVLTLHFQLKLILIIKRQNYTEIKKYEKSTI